MFLERMAISPIQSITCATVTNISSITLLRCSSVQSGKQSFKLISARIRGLPIFSSAHKPVSRPFYRVNEMAQKRVTKAQKYQSQMPQFFGCKYDHEKCGS